MLGLKLAGVSPPHPSMSSVLSVSAIVGVAMVILCSLPPWPLPILLCCISLLSVNSVLLYHQFRTLPSLFKAEVRVREWWRLLLPVGTAVHCLAQMSSSLLEEEHQLWYWLWVTVGLLRLRQNCARWLCVLVIHRVLRALNQTGDRWAHLPDLSDWLTLTSNASILSAFCALSLLWLCWYCTQVLSRSWIPTILCAITVSCIYQHKAAIHQAIPFISPSSNGVSEARMCWLLLLLLLLQGRSLNTLLVCWMLSSSLLLRSHNTVLIPALYFFSQSVALYPSPAHTVLHHWLGAVFFFYQGNLNTSLASVDLAAGYIGLEQYNIVIVGALLLAHTYAMPVLAYTLSAHSIVTNQR
ncbi:hypothetical protein J6590_060875 [Homalodisca vitripennis]|nr:hypothetical protein J6590_060875 [Homalodisca vitripennis]